MYFIMSATLLFTVLCCPLPGLLGTAIL